MYLGGEVPENAGVSVCECGLIWMLCRWCIWVFCVFDSVGVSVCVIVSMCMNIYINLS